MRERFTIWLIFGCLLCCINGASFGRQGTERPTYGVAFLNDFYFGKDEELSGAWSLQKHTSVADSWDTLENVPDFVRRWGASIPALDSGKRFYRVSAALGQITQTPVDLKRRNLIEEDAPYAGALLASLSWYGFNDNEFTGFEFVTGVVGPASGVEEVQKASHKLLKINAPKGWDNQLRNEPIINFNYTRKHKISKTRRPSGLSFDTTLSGNVSLGNLVTQAGVAIEIRVGKDLPTGFVFTPNPVGFDISHKASLSPPDPTATSLYGSLVLRGNGVAHNIFLDGNTFKDSHSVDSKSFVGQAIIGLHYEKQNWSAHFSLLLPTDTVDTSHATAVEGRSDLAALTIEWRR